MVDHRPDLNSARPLLRHRQGLIEVGHVDDRKTSDDLFRLDERAVGNRHTAVLARDRRGRAWPAKLLARDDFARPVVLFEPLARLLVAGHRLFPHSGLELVYAFHRAAEQENVFHLFTPPSATTNGARWFRHEPTTTR